MKTNLKTRFYSLIAPSSLLRLALIIGIFLIMAWPVLAQAPVENELTAAIKLISDNIIGMSKTLAGIAGVLGLVLLGLSKILRQFAPGLAQSVMPGGNENFIWTLIIGGLGIYAGAYIVDWIFGALSGV